MSSTAHHSVQCVKHDGLYYEEDFTVGEQVDRLLANGYYFKNVEGLRFCKARTFDDERVRTVVESLLEGSSLGLYKSYGAAQYDYCILNKFSEEPKVLLVQLWATGSQVIFYRGSHHHVLNAVAAPTGLLMIPPLELARSGITKELVYMEKGGLSILDGRTGFKIQQGRAVVLAFAAPDELVHWAKMKLPNLPELEMEVQHIKMDSKKIGVNFEFVTSKPAP